MLALNANSSSDMGKLTKTGAQSYLMLCTAVGLKFMVICL